MKKKQIGGLIVAAVLFVFVGAASVLTHAVSSNLLGETLTENLKEEFVFDAPTENYIAVVDVVGIIEEQQENSLFEMQQEYLHTDTMEYIDHVMYDPNNRGLLLYVDSPGGTVYESEELYRKLMEYKEVTGNPIWAYMAHYAASGGYMVSAAADYILANSNTVTGSIGVIMSGYDLSGLYEKLGIRYFSITSGEYKDSTQMTEDQMEIYQSQVDECYEKFVNIVETGRNLPKDQVLELADGRTYTATQALKKGLIDEISSYEDAQDKMCEELGVYEFYEQDMSRDGLALFLSQIKGLIPKSESQILKETASEMESGVLMYYAESLR